MRSGKFFTLLAFLALVLASLACQSVTGGKEAPGPTTDLPSSAPLATSQTAESIPAPGAAILPAPVTSTGPGKACFGFRDGGLTCLDEKGWKTYNQENSDLPNDYLTAGAFCPDGRLALAHYEGVSLFDGKKWEHIAKPEGYSAAEAIACDAQGGIWVAHFKGVSHYAKGAWKTYGSDQLATGESANELVYNLVAAADGKIWAVTSRSVAFFADEKWTVFQKGQGFQDDLFFKTLALDATGRPWVGYSTGVAVYDQGEWKELKKSGYDSPEALGLDARGQLWLGTLSKGLSMFNGNTWSNYSKETESLTSNQINALATDSLGRVWVGTSYGLSVFDGEQWQTYHMHTADLADNLVKFVVVAKDGPTLPAPAEKEKASLTGKLEDAGNQPLVGKRVEICVEPLGDQFSGETPCSDQPFFMFAETNDQGVFVFENVPAGYYVIVSETNTSWAQLTDQLGIGSERTLIKPGEKHDIGTLTLQKE